MGVCNCGTCSPAAPSIAPRNVTVDRTSRTTITVSWIPLNLVEAQGFIRSYTVFYDPITSRKRKLSGGMKTVPGNESSTTVGGLQNTDYNVSIVSSTVAGGGPRSVAVTSAAPSEFRTTVHVVIVQELMMTSYIIGCISNYVAYYPFHSNINISDTAYWYSQLPSVGGKY